MADFITTRCMDDFFLNPTIPMEREAHQSAMLDDKQHLSSITSHDKVFNDAPEPKVSVSIKDLVNVWYSYTSEEEAASPIEDDKISLRSFDSLSSDFSLNQAIETCTEAHAVKIQPAGKATVLSMPKIVEIPARRGVRRPLSLDYNSTRLPYVLARRSSNDFSSRVARVSQDTRGTRSISSRNNSMSSTDMHSPVSTAPSSLDEEEEGTQLGHKKSFSRHVPLMEAARNYSPTLSSAPATPIFPTSSIFSEGSHTSSFAPSSSRNSIRRKTKLPSITTLNRLGKTLTRRDSVVGRMDLSSSKEPEFAAVTPVVSQPRVNISGNRPKMVARAANERAPPIVLPPFPDDEADDTEE